MAQGDSIGGMLQGDIDGIGTFILRPPVGQVWIITYIIWSGYTSTIFTDGIHAYGLPATLSDNPNIKLFIDNNFWIQFYFSAASSSRWVQWSGVQFK